MSISQSNESRASQPHRPVSCVSSIRDLRNPQTTLSYSTLASGSPWTNERSSWLCVSLQVPLHSRRSPWKHSRVTSHLAQLLDVRAMRHTAASFSTTRRQFPARRNCGLASSSKPAADPERCCDATAECFADHPGSRLRRWIVNSWVAQLKLINVTLVTPWQYIFLRCSFPFHGKASSSWLTFDFDT